MRLLIMACSTRKHPYAGLLPAIERYDGPAFHVLRAYQRTHPDAPLTVLILSARYGLIHADTAIPFYDERMTQRQALALRPQVERALTDLQTSSDSYTSTLVMLGQTYRLALPLDAVWTPPFGEVTWTNGGIGTQLGQLKRWLYEA